MSNILILKPLAMASAAASAGSGASNLLTDDPKEIWTAGGAGACTLTLELTAPSVIDAVYLGFSNLLPGNVVAVDTAFDSAMTGATALETRTVIDGLDITHMIFTGTARTARYVRLTLTATHTLQAALVRIGAKFQPAYNMEWGSGRGVIDTGAKDPLLGGGFGIGEGARKAAYRWTLGDLSDAEVETLYDAVTDRGETRPIIVVEDPANTTYIGKRIHYGLMDRIEFYERANPGQSRWSLSLQEWGAAPRFGVPLGVWLPSLIAPAAWWDPSDLSTMWQDSARTTPAAVGQPVGAINDKSGNGVHLTQSNSPKRPTLQSGSGLYYLDFDGTDDGLESATGLSWPTTTEFFGMFRPDAGETTWLTAWDTTNINEYFGVVQSGGGSANNASVGSPTNFVNGSSVGGTRGDLYTAIGTGTAKLLEVRGMSLAFSGIAMANYGTFEFDGRFYGAVIAPTLSTTDRASMRTWLGAKGGITL